MTANQETKTRPLETIHFPKILGFEKSGVLTNEEVQELVSKCSGFLKRGNVRLIKYIDRTPEDLKPPLNENYGICIRTKRGDDVISLWGIQRKYNDNLELRRNFLRIGVVHELIEQWWDTLPLEARGWWSMKRETLPPEELNDDFFTRGSDEPIIEDLCTTLSWRIMGSNFLRERSPTRYQLAEEFLAICREVELL